MDLTLLQTYAQTQAAGDHSGHAADHLQRVVANARRLLIGASPADEAIVLAAAWLHDTYDEKLVADSAAAKQATAQQLLAAGATVAQQEAVLTIIDRMSFRANLAAKQPLSLEGQLVQDADRLDALGAIGIARTFMYSGAHGKRLYDPDQPPSADLTAATYRQAETPAINHFEEKLFKLAAMMNTAAGKKLAEHRTKAMRAFVDEFFEEIQGKK